MIMMMAILFLTVRPYIQSPVIFKCQSRVPLSEVVRTSTQSGKFWDKDSSVRSTVGTAAVFLKESP
jgi:hypothetical protein